MSEPQHYVYAYSEPGCDRPFYIGKGKGRRAWRHLCPSQQRKSHFYSKLKSLATQGVKPEIEIIYWAYSDEEACEAERYFIAFFGRRDLGNGCLTNHTAGGGGMDTPSLQTRAKLRHSRLGKRHSRETKQKIRDAHKGKAISKDTRLKLSIAHRGKTASDATRRRMRQAHLGRKLSATTKSRIAAAQSHRTVPVIATNLLTGDMLHFQSLSEAGRHGFNRAHITSCLTGKHMQHKGYRWSYADGRNNKQTYMASDDS